jgi:hypothetical protein
MRVALKSPSDRLSNDNNFERECQEELLETIRIQELGQKITQPDNLQLSIPN